MNLTRKQSLAVAVGSALLMAAAFPPIQAWPLALVGMIPLLVVLFSLPGNRLGEPGVVPPDSAPASAPYGEAAAATVGHPGGTAPGRSRTPGRFWPGFRLGWCFGLIFFLATLWWVQYVTLPGMVLLCMYLALFPALFCGVAAWVGAAPRGGAVRAFLTVVFLSLGWAGLEWVRSLALSGFPWNGFGVPLFELHAARRLSAYTGAAGLSGAVMAIALAGALAVRQGDKKSWIALFRWAAVLVLVELVFRSGIGSVPEKPLAFHEVLVVQPNVSMEEKFSPDPEVARQRYLQLADRTDEGLRQPPLPELVVWPESAVPQAFHDMVQGGAFIDQLQQGEFTLVTGADHEDWGRFYNSLVSMRGGPENYLLHAKVCLVPFGEFIPFRKQIPLLEKMLGHLIPMDFTSGNSREPMRLPGQPYGIIPLVCFEDTIGWHARKFVRPGPQVLVNITNDNWFRESPAAEMHFVNARWRAPELNRTLLRSANTGVSAIVSPTGGVQRIPAFQDGTLRGWFSPGDGSMTFYARYGDVIPMGGGAAALLGLAGLAIRRRRRAPESLVP